MNEESEIAVAEPAPQAVKPRYRVRLRFSKRGDLRFIGHQDLLRCWDRACRRAGVRVKLSEGFHPKPVFSSPLSLALGVEGLDEIVEFELADPMSVDEVVARLTPELDAGLEIVSACEPEPRDRAKVVAVEYSCPLLGRDPEGVRRRAAELLASESLPHRRVTPGKPDKTVDLRPFLLGFDVSEDAVRCRAAVSDSGAVRPDEWVNLLGLADALAEGAVVVRTRVELAPPPTSALGASQTGRQVEKELA